MNGPLMSVEIAEPLAPVVVMLQAMMEEAGALAGAAGLEALVHGHLKEMERKVMEVCVVAKASEASADNVREVRCLRCGKGWATRIETAAPRYAVTVRGRVDFARPVYRCTERECQRERCLFDEELGLDGKEHYTPALQNKIAWVGASGSFPRASRDLRQLLEIEVGPKAVHRVTEKAGRKALALQDKEVRERGAPASLEAPVVAQERPGTVVIEMDGTCAMGRDGAGHEVKCATVFGLDARAVTGSPGKERPLLLRRCYCATSLGIRAFGAMVWALASWWGVRSARRIVVIGDGIDWIWNYSRDRLHFTLPDGSVVRPVEIVDFWHGAENLGKARQWIFADPEGKAARQWFDTWRHRLREGGIDEVIAELDKRAKTGNDATARDALRVRKAYFENHRERMRYDKFEAMGLPIGSGAIEGTCKNLIKGRMDGVGMRWDAQDGIEMMAALRVRMFNERWDDLWEARPPLAA